MMFGTMNELIMAERRISELEADNARLRDALTGCIEQIYDDNYQFAKTNAAINGHDNWRDDLPEAWHDARRVLEVHNE